MTWMFLRIFMKQQDPNRPNRSQTEFDRSNPNARQFIPIALEFAMLGLGFSSVDEAMEYLVSED